jgi:DNA-binding XRE family transcriptional regulator
MASDRNHVRNRDGGDERLQKNPKSDFWLEILCKHNDCLPEMVHNRIALFRAERQMSRKDLAELVGVNPQTIGFLERGSYSPSVELALKLAAVFRVNVHQLFALEPFPALADQLRSGSNTGGSGAGI